MRYLFVLFMLISTTGFAQWKSYIIGVKGDTLNRVDPKGRKQGPWVAKVESLRGERGYEEEGGYYNDLKEDIWRKFSLEGDLIAVENYRWGMKHGKAVYFNPLGELIREESWKAIDPKNPYDTVNVYDVADPTKVIGKQVIKVDGASYKHGTWKFYDPMTGRVEETQQWVMNKPKTEVDLAVDDMAPIDVGGGEANATAKKDEKKPPVTKKPQAILDYEKKNSGKKKIKVRDGNTGG